MTQDHGKRKTIRFKGAASSGRAGSRKSLKDPASTPVAGEMERSPDGTRAEQPPSADRDLKIRERAYLIFESSGRQHGHDVDHWLEAERQVTITEPSGESAGRSDEARD